MRIGFIFSLPRAGSTYVQRVLASSPEIATTPEPWLMPALFGIRSGAPPLAEFAYDHVRIGLNDVIAALDNGETIWRESIAQMAAHFYGAFTQPGQLFLDKTPRNAQFCNEILEAFPDAPILFLWRNPLAVAASINRTWGAGRWKTYFYHYDLYAGLPTMIDTALKYKESSRVMVIRYEDLVTDPERYWPGVFEHFGAEYKPEFVNSPLKMVSRMGDITGQKKYATTAADSLNAWQEGFGSRARRHWAKCYLEEIGSERMRAMGYDLDTILGELSLTGDQHWSDLFQIGLSPAYHWLEPFILRSKRRRDGRAHFARR